MGRWIAAAGMLALVLWSPELSAQTAGAIAQEPLTLINAVVLNVVDGTMTANRTVVLREGRIASTGTGAAPSGTRVIDLRGRYVVPGLIDAHTHIGTLRALRTALESGVTTVRSSGVSSYVDVGMRELVKQGTVAGPDVLAAGYHVRPSVAEEAFLDHPGLAGLMRAGMTSPDALRRMVQANISRGVDWIKVLATERAGTAETDPRKQVYTEAELKIVVDEAATKGLSVQAHAHGAEGALAAVKAGVRSIEHGTYLSDETLTLMKDRGTFFVPTYATVIDLVEPGGDYDNRDLHLRGTHMITRLEDTVKRAHQAGVKLVTGADTSYGPQSVTRISREVAELTRMGMSPLAALQAATTRAAELLHLDKQTGQVSTGFEADIVVVERNPLEHIGTLQDPLLVVSNGRVGLDRLNFGK
ncbi:MAG: amidohydrolase family protein [Vicinamibacterales bacterium]